MKGNRGEKNRPAFRVRPGREGGMEKEGWKIRPGRVTRRRVGQQRRKAKTLLPNLGGGAIRKNLKKKGTNLAFANDKKKLISRRLHWGGGGFTKPRRGTRGTA